jgi:hypothetical protein
MHFMTLYACGHVYAQCRCISIDKSMTRMSNPCPGCIGSETYPDPRGTYRDCAVLAPGDVSRRIPVGRD